MASIVRSFSTILLSGRAWGCRRSRSRSAGFALRWYSLAYIAGILIGWWLLSRMIRRPGAPMTVRHLDDLISWATLGIIAGGRLGYVLFYDLGAYLADPLKVLRLWEGGMSFHGGFAGVLIATVLYARKKGLHALRLLDYAAVITPIGLFLGRLANFVNGELPGRVTDGTWGIVFPGDSVARHPSTLYAAASEGLLLLAVLTALFWFTRARLRPGLLGGVFVGGYGLVRFVLERFREPDAQLGLLPWGLSMGQTLCVPMILFGLWLIWRSLRREPVAADAFVAA